jgi:hypothetical protein
MAVGKSNAAASLIGRHRFQRISSSEYLRGILCSAGQEVNRRSLQNLGDRLDVSTDFRWLIDDVALPTFAKSTASETRWLVDAARKQRQVEHFKNSVPGTIHVHLTASELTLRERYEVRRGEGELSYDDAISHPNEQSARALINIADVIVPVEGLSSEEIADIILSRG